MSDAPLAAIGEAGVLVREQPALSREAALAAVAECLAQLVPADLVAWNDVDLDARRGDVWSPSGDGRPDKQTVQRMLDTATDNPMILSYVATARAGDFAPRRLSDLVTDSELRRTRAYPVVFKPLSGDHQVTVLSSRSASRHGQVWGFNRASSDFTDADVDRLRTVQPFLAIIGHLIATPEPPGADTRERWGLTAREAEIVGLVARGLTADAIASLCGISGRTVRKHLENAYSKLGCHDKVTAVLRFRGEVDRP